MGSVAWVALGGALGSVTRYTTVRGFAVMLGDAQPWGTLIVNVVGSFLMGLLAALIARKFADADAVRVFLLPGFLGGFTTFSAFSLDVFNLMQRGENGTAITYVLGSVILSLVAVFAGYALMARSIA